MWSISILGHQITYPIQKLIRYWGDTKVAIKEAKNVNVDDQVANEFVEESKLLLYVALFLTTWAGRKQFIKSHL